MNEVTLVTHLSADELAELVGCRPNQRLLMQRWLTDNRWHFAVDSKGVPKVARVYYERRMGLTEGPAPRRAHYDDTPNYAALEARTGKGRAPRR